jgi:hypothetical protein
LRFQSKIGVAMVITGLSSMVGFVLALIWTYPYCNRDNITGCGAPLVHASSWLLILGIFLIGFGIVAVLSDWNPITFHSKKPQ